MRKILCFLIVSMSLSFSSDFKKEVLEHAKYLDGVFNIDKNIILAYIKTESDYNPYAMLIKSKDIVFLDSVLKDFGFKTKKTKNFISVYPKDKESAELLYYLVSYNKKILQITNYDFGIMQLNTNTIKAYNLDEKMLYLDFKKNMIVGADIMRGCYHIVGKEGNMQNIIECYNKGTDMKKLASSNKDYYVNFIKNYKTTIKGTKQ